MRRLIRSLFAVVAVAAVASTARAADLEPLLPAETEQVVFLNFKQVLTSDIIKNYALGQMQQALKGQDAEKMLEKLGLDPLKDIEKATLGLWGKDQNDMSGVAVIHGTFKADKLLAAAKEAESMDKDKVSVLSEGDFKLVKITGDNGKPFFVSVADETTIVGGTDKKFVTTGLTAFNKKAKPALKKDLSDLVLKQDGKASMFYCGSVKGKLDDIPGDFSQLKNLGIDGDQLKKQLTKLNTVAATVRLGEDVSFDLTMGMDSTDAADDFGLNVSKIVDAAKTFLPFAAAQAPQAKPVIGDLTESIKTKVKDKDVTLGFKLTAKAIASATEGSGGSDEKKDDKKNDKKNDKKDDKKDEKKKGD